MVFFRLYPIQELLKTYYEKNKDLFVRFLLKITLFLVHYVCERIFFLCFSARKYSQQLFSFSILHIFTRYTWLRLYIFMIKTHDSCQSLHFFFSSFFSFLKGSVSRDLIFEWWFFASNWTSWSPSRYPGMILIFAKNLQRYLNVKSFLRCKIHRRVD